MKSILRLFIFLLSTSFLFAQAPQKMSYQVVIRTSNGLLLANKTVAMRLSILQNGASGAPVYVETQTTTTNANGLATLQIGAGTDVSGVFANINWSAGTYFLKSETDPEGGSNYTISGTSQLLSVPYALYAEKSGISGNQKGDMQYWDGTKWVLLPTGTHGQSLFICDGVPTWGFCKPTIITQPITSIATTSALSGITVPSYAGLSPGINGICYSTSPSPTINDNQIGWTIGIAAPSRSIQIPNLAGGTTYYVRAYVTFNDNGVGTIYGNEVSFTTLANVYSVGQRVGGGIVFYIDGTGQHGLIADSSYIRTPTTTFAWGCSGANVATDSVVGSGQTNTTAIINACRGTVSAAKIADSLTIKGYSDWYLPSSKELFLMANQRNVIGGFVANASYWSSTQNPYDNTRAASITFINGTANYTSNVSSNKTALYYVRPVRKF